MTEMDQMTDDGVIETRFTRMFGIRHPIMQGGMQ